MHPQRKDIRLKGYDYGKPGMYFITLCCAGRKHLFGEIENGRMILNDYGTVANDEWLKICKIRENVKLHEYVIMPNHIHAIIEITRCRGVIPYEHVWQRNFNDHIVRNYKDHYRIKNYIDNNPENWEKDELN